MEVQKRKRVGAVEFDNAMPERKMMRMSLDEDEWILPFSSEDIPAEMWLLIFQWLPVSDLCLSAGLVCKTWYMLSLSPDLWKYLCVRFDHYDVPMTVSATSTINWKRHFKERSHIALGKWQLEEEDVVWREKVITRVILAPDGSYSWEAWPKDTNYGALCIGLYSAKELAQGTWKIVKDEAPDGIHSYTLVLDGVGQKSDHYSLATSPWAQHFEIAVSSFNSTFDYRGRWNW